MRHQREGTQTYFSSSVYGGSFTSIHDHANNIRTIEVFQEDRRLRTGAYLTNAADVAAIEAAIDWQPEGDQDGTTYSIAPGAGGSYQVTATAPDGTSVCLVLPDGNRC